MSIGKVWFLFGRRYHKISFLHGHRLSFLFFLIEM